MMRIKRLGLQSGEKTWNGVWVITKVYTTVEVVNKLNAELL